MGRRKIPVTGNGPVAQLAIALRDLRESSGLTLRELAKLVGYSHSTLSSAERGRIPPSWSVTEAFVRGCGSSSPEWKPLWTAAAAAAAPDLMLAAASGPGAVAQLPSGTPGFVGRSHELAQLFTVAELVDQETYGPPLVCIMEGMAGVGKTALALQFAHLAAKQFADGQLFVSVQGHWPYGGPLAPREVLVQLLRGLGQRFVASAMSIEELAGIYRSLTAGMKILIVLDDAQTADQVRAAIPGWGPCFVVITSRNSLNGLVVRDGAFQMQLGVLSDSDSLAVLAHIMTQHVVDSDPPAASQLVKLCGHLPLALRIAAHHMTSKRCQSLAGLVTAVASDPGCLDVLAVDGDETASIRSVLSWSYRSLRPELSDTFRLIGRDLSSEFDLAQAIEVTGGDPGHVRVLLRDLVDTNMLQDLGGDRYGVHRLVRLYASERARAEG
jgi:DNA-binding XRE family transcriptional regulator